MNHIEDSIRCVICQLTGVQRIEELENYRIRVAGCGPLVFPQQLISNIFKKHGVCLFEHDFFTLEKQVNEAIRGMFLCSDSPPKTFLAKEDKKTGRKLVLRKLWGSRLYVFLAAVGLCVYNNFIGAYATFDLITMDNLFSEYRLDFYTVLIQGVRNEFT